MARYNKIRLGDCLVQKGLLTEEQLNNALQEQKNKGLKLGETVVIHFYIFQLIYFLFFVHFAKF